MTILAQLNKNLSLQMANIMGADSDEEELKAVAEQTRQLTAVSKQIIDSHRLVLDANKFAYSTGEEVRMGAELLEVGYGGIDG
ncbi:hypothetical protein J3492_00125 [Psychrobacter sp. F1192]|uniref:Uncharacterized protein n=1 Tax=Psychrobacter coccoides TaxID=2818440 RepID=A0ABS3NKS0_9GAMM|nr:hypothetical protein [Psychrobacter coccoides]MBO1529619.1 hypothetical protein [Psychrobacter coccoides]